MAEADSDQQETEQQETEQQETEQQESEQPTTGPADPGRRRGAVRWAFTAVAFVAGLFVGGVAVGLVSEGAPKFPQGAGTSAPSSASSSAPSSAPASSSAATGGAGAVVNDACLRALDAAQALYGAVRDLGDAAGRFDAAGVNQAIRRLQPLQSRLQDDVGACRVITRLPEGSATAAPTG